jgi:hypothetical protein
MTGLRHYILTVGRTPAGVPVRKLRALTRGTPTLLAFQQYDRISDHDLEMILRDLVAEQERRDLIPQGH